MASSLWNLQIFNRENNFTRYCFKIIECKKLLISLPLTLVRWTNKNKNSAFFLNPSGSEDIKFFCLDLIVNAHAFPNNRFYF